MRSWAACAAAGLLLAAAAAARDVPGQKLTGAGELGAGELGNSVAASADGTVLLIGATNDHSLIAQLENKRVHSQALGAAWVFTRRGSGRWRQEKLVAGHERGPAGFGNSVALSADGRTALIGGPSGYGGIGDAWVFTRTGTGWQQQAQLLPRGITSSSGYVRDPTGFGASVALSADGDTALVGGPAAADRVGAAWIFTRSGTTWRQQGRLAAGGERGGGGFGTSVSLSAGGDIALVGAPFDDNGAGGAWIFARAGGGWRQAGGKLTARGGSGYGRFGTSVALSRTGTTALVGAPVEDNGAGAAWAFTRSGSTWTQAVRRLRPRDESGPAQFGDSVAISAAGTTALVGGAFDRNGAGAAWLFRRTRSGWNQQGTKLAGRGAAGPGPIQFGASVALSAAGTTVVAGGIGDGDFAGAAWVFDPIARR